MDSRRYSKIGFTPQEVDAAISEILFEINSMAGDQYAASEIERCFWQIDALRATIQIRFENVVTLKLLPLIYDACQQPIDVAPPVRRSMKGLKSSEREIANQLEEAGYIVLRNGWPDFLVIKGKEILGIEVKSGRQKASPHQSILHGVLRKAGIPVHVVRSTKALKRCLS